MKLDQVIVNKPNRKILPGEEITFEEAVDAEMIDVYKDGRPILLRCPFCGSENFSMVSPATENIHAPNGTVMSKYLRDPLVSCGQCGSQIGTSSGAMCMNYDRKMKPIMRKLYFVKEGRGGDGDDPFAH